MIDTSLQDLVGAALTTGSAITAAVLVFRQKKHENRQTGEAQLITSLQEETKRLGDRDRLREDEMQEMRGLVTQLYSGVWTLIGQLRAANIEPNWTPVIPTPPSSKEHS